ncbi:MAG: MATE family efflux transporter [Sulfurospirillum sp.]|nr:MATE family efflux transporter [Sulfurospirillum sp.]
MNTSSLLSEPISKLLVRLAIPSSLGLMFNTFYNIVDTYYAGLISTQALSALSSSAFLFFVIVGLGYGGSNGITTLVGHALGEQKSDEARMYASKGLGLLLLLGVTMGIFGYLTTPTMLLWVGVEPIYQPMALAYIEVILLGTPLFFANFGLNAILVATGDTKSYRNTLIFGFVANLLLNPLFIFGWASIPAMGIGGIALSTVLIQALNASYLCVKVFKTKLMVLTYFMPDKESAKIIFAQSLPAGLNMLMISFGSLMALYFVTHYGYKAVAGYGIGYRVEQLLLLPALGISSATLSLVSNNMGAKRVDRVRESLFTALKYGYSIAFFGVIILYFSAHWIIAHFDKDPDVIAYAYAYISVMMLLFFGYVTHFVCVATLQGIKHPRMIFYIGAFRQLLAPIIIYMLIVKVWQLSFVWMWIGLACIVYSSAIVILGYTLNILKTIDDTQRYS